MVEQSGVHDHRPDDVDDAEDDRTVDGATGNPEAIDAADDRKSCERKKFLKSQFSYFFGRYILLLLL